MFMVLSPGLSRAALFRPPGGLSSRLVVVICLVSALLRDLFLTILQWVINQGFRLSNGFPDTCTSFGSGGLFALVGKPITLSLLVF